MLDTQPQPARRAYARARQAPRDRRRRKALLILAVLCSSRPPACVLLLGGLPGSGHRPRIAARKLLSTAGRPCPGARSCPYATRRGRRPAARGTPACARGDRHRAGRSRVRGRPVQLAVRRFSPTGGSKPNGAPTAPVPASSGRSRASRWASDGDVYVVDSTHDRVERFTPDGRLLGSFGSPGSGVGQLSLRPGYTADEPPGGAIRSPDATSTSRTAATAGSSASTSTAPIRSCWSAGQRAGPG